jgi:hypothetical protein
MPLSFVQNALKQIKKEKLIQVVNYLQAENKIQVDKEGNITL